MFAISEEAKKRVYEIFNRTEEMVKEDAQTVKEWMKSQPHLPEILSDTQIKNFLNLNKFSLEKAKQKIDMYYTMRSLMADFYSVSNPKLERTQRLLDKMHVCTFPEALDGIHRVIFIKVKESDVLDMETFTALLFAVFEVRIHEDFMFSDILILDMENVSLNDVRKVTPSLLKQPIILYQMTKDLRNLEGRDRLCRNSATT
ncbi:retinol-binding protein pinta-like isoform X3 [Zophobas morio]|uniref:retinol-binding protein pinta-like isoform X3 n=1 Tax=Zophobas morio TaxID=2755281 RepID=UPI003083B0C5